MAEIPRYRPTIVPDLPMEGWVGHIRRIVESGTIGEFSNDQLVSLIKKSDREAMPRIVGYRPREFLRRLRLDYALDDA